MPAAEHMDVQMVDRLTALRSLIDHKTKTVMASRATNLCGFFEQRRNILRIRLVEKCGTVLGMYHRQDENVRRRLRIDVFDRDDVIVPEDFACRNFSGYDLTEDAAGLLWSRHYAFGFSNSKLIAVSGRGM